MVYRPLLVTAFHMVAAYSLIKLATLFKVSFIVGSSLAFFSGTSIAVPLLGSCLSILGIGAAIGVPMMGTWALGGISSLHYLAYHIPGLFAAASFRYPLHALIHLGIPLLCMVLFVVHPVGSYAFPYALYWLIPLALYLKQSTSLFARALSATFIAHAVGSVIWLYTMPMTAAAWLALIPVVAVERLCFALGMVVVYQAVGHSISLLKKVFGIYVQRLKLGITSGI